jgi:hypothetical protein
MAVRITDRLITDRSSHCAAAAPETISMISFVIDAWRMRL